MELKQLIAKEKVKATNDTRSHRSCRHNRCQSHSAISVECSVHCHKHTIWGRMCDQLKERDIKEYCTCCRAKKY